MALSNWPTITHPARHGPAFEVAEAKQTVALAKVNALLTVKPRKPTTAPTTAAPTTTAPTTTAPTTTAPTTTAPTTTAPTTASGITSTTTSVTISTYQSTVVTYTVVPTVVGVPHVAVGDLSITMVDTATGQTIGVWTNGTYSTSIVESNGEVLANASPIIAFDEPGDDEVTLIVELAQPRNRTLDVDRPEFSHRAHRRHEQQ